MLESIGCLREIEDSILPVLTDDGYDDYNSVLPVGAWVDSIIQITLDSGCVEHVMCLEDAPGYDGAVTQSAGSLRKQNFLVGNGQALPNQGEMKLNMESHDGIPLSSVFQVAGVTRPLMSVGRVCDQGMKCVFDKEKAVVIAPDGREVCCFERRGGLYVASLTLKQPEGFGGPAR